MPTIAEAGVAGFENTIWNGILASGATPKAALSALYDALAQTLQAPEFKDRLAQEGAVPFAGDTPDAYAAFIRVEIAKWGKVVRQAGIKAE